MSAIGAFHAEDSRLSGNSIDEWLQKLFRKHLPQFKKSGTVVGRISLVRLHLGNAKKALISGLAPILISPTPEATATLRMIVAEVTKEPAFERASVNCL